MTFSTGQERRLKVIVFSDVVDSSAQIFADELIAIQRIKEDLAMIREVLKRHGGSLVKSLGDGILATFDAPTQALEFVEDVVLRITRRGQHSLQHRFGLHTGEIYVNGDDIIGQGVHLASRLQTTAPVNGVAFVQSTYELIDPRFQNLAELVGPVQLKGLPVPVICYAIESQNLIGSKVGQEQSGIDLEGLLTDTPYRLERPLGSSPRTATFLVRETSRDRRAVLKLIPCDGSNLEALKVEAACLDRLRHPRIPRFVDGFEQQGAFLFLQEYIAGASLQGSLDYLRRKQRLAELLRQVLEVLEVLHTAGLVHGDLHPANLIQGEDGGSLFVVNFDLLKARSSGAAEEEIPPGRPFYSPPERARFGSLTGAGDLYSLGVLALSLYTGQPPEQLYDQEEGRWQLDDLDPEVVSWLAPLLEESLARRLERASDALQLLDRPNTPAGEAGSSERSQRLPLPPGPALAGSVRKSTLVRHLAGTYGPVVEMLLESFPSSLSLTEVEGVRQRLVAAGLSQSDVDRALTVSEEPAAAAASSEASVPGSSATPAASVTGTTVRAGSGAGAAVAPATAPAANSEPLAGWRAGILRHLSQMVGPIAEALCTEELYQALLEAPASARRQLLSSSVPEGVVDELLSLAASSLPAPELHAGPSPAVGAPGPGADGERTAGQRADPAEADSTVNPAPGVPTEQQLRSDVLDLIGPIGDTLVDSVSTEAPAERPKMLLRSLEGYGVDGATLAELRRRWTTTGPG